MLNKKISESGLKIPCHIAFIIDGNGRWAKMRGLPRTIGHRQGIQAVKETIENCNEFGVKIASFFCFSTENWQRPQEEVDEIFRLFNEFFSKYKNVFEKNNIRLVHSGDLNRLDGLTRRNILSLEDSTAQNTGMIVNMCINYGSRQEIVMAVNAIISEGKTCVTEQDILSHLYTKNLPDPDFIIRTSGEKRLSNFMLFQSAYSELYFPEIFWPDFDRKALITSLEEFNKRNRRYGKI